VCRIDGSLIEQVVQEQVKYGQEIIPTKAQDSGIARGA
jgi:hypothetical protein